MTDKTMKIGASLEPQASPGMERAIKKYGQMVQQASNMEGMFKSMNKWMKMDKELAKTFKEHSNKQLMEKSKLLEQINKRVESSIKLNEKAERAASRLTNMQFKRMGTDEAAMRALGLGDKVDAMRSGNLSAVRGRAMHNVQMGAAAIGSSQADEDQAAADAKAQKYFNIYRMAMMAQTGISAVTGGMSAFNRMPMDELRNKAASAGAAGSLYSQLGSGDYTNLDALARAGGMGALLKFGENERSATRWGYAGRIGVGGAGIAGGLALGAGGAGSGFGAAAGVAMGAPMVIGGLGGIGSALKDIVTGHTDAAVSGALQTGIEQLANQNPFRKAQIHQFQGNLPTIHRLGALGEGGVGEYQDIARMAAMGGITANESLPMFEMMRSKMGFAQAKAFMPQINQALDVFKMDRGTAASLSSSLASSTMGGAEGFSAPAAISGGSMATGAQIGNLERIIRRAFAGGISDSGLRTSIAEAVAQRSAALPGSSIAGIDALTSTITKEAKLAAIGRGGTGTEMTSEDINIGSAVVGGFGAGGMFGGGGAFSGINTRVQNAKMQLANKYNLTTDAKRALINILPNDMSQNTQKWRDFTALAGINGETFNAEFKESMKGMTTSFGYGDDRYAAIGAPGDYRVNSRLFARVKSVGGLDAGDPNAAPALSSGGTAKDQEQDQLKTANINNAVVQMSTLLDALSAPDAAKNMAATTTAAKEYMVVLGQLATQTVDQLTALKAQFPGIFDFLNSTSTGAAP
jgi:hypothetical protein